MVNLFCHTCKGHDGIPGREVQYMERNRHRGHDVEDTTEFKKNMREFRKTESDIRNFSPLSNEQIELWWERNKNTYVSKIYNE